MARTTTRGGKRTRVRELRFPLQGVVRRQAVEATAAFQEPYPSPWCTNVLPEDTIAKRLRGGSRAGLTEYADDLDGQTIDGMIHVTLATASGVSSLLAVVSDAAAGTFNAGVYAALNAALQTDAGVPILTDAGVPILVNTGTVPATCYLCARGRQVFAINSSSSSILDLSTGAVDTLTATDGTVPASVTHGCVYRDRLVLAGADNTVYFARRGDPTDWDYGADVGDSDRPVPIQLAEAEEMGEVCTALVPFKDSTLLAASRYGLWLLTGDPATGRLQNLARGVGIIRSSAWCKIEDSQLGDMAVRYAIAFLSTTGLFMISPSGDGLQCLSEDRLPQELISIADTTTVSMVYSPEDRGIYIFLVPSSGAGTHFFFDFAHKGFWPLYLLTTHQPLYACWHDGSIVLACKDGVLRTMGGANDDGTAIQSHLLVGPLRLGGPNEFGMLTNLHGIMATGGGTVYWRIIGADTAETACANGKAAIEAYLAGNLATADAYASASGTWTAGRSKTSYPRVRAMWGCLWLRSSAAWAYEGVTVESTEAGRWR